MTRVNFFEALRRAFDPAEIIKVLCDLCAAYGRQEIDTNTMSSLIVVAQVRSDSYHQQVRRRRGTETLKEKAAKRHAAWQEEAIRVAAAHPTWNKGDVADQVRINLDYQGSADTISRVIKIS